MPSSILVSASRSSSRYVCEGYPVPPCLSFLSRCGRRSNGVRKLKKRSYRDRERERERERRGRGRKKREKAQQEASRTGIAWCLERNERHNSSGNSSSNAMRADTGNVTSDDGRDWPIGGVQSLTTPHIAADTRRRRYRGHVLSEEKSSGRESKRRCFFPCPLGHAGSLRTLRPSARLGALNHHETSRNLLPRPGAGVATLRGADDTWSIDVDATRVAGWFPHFPTRTVRSLAVGGPDQKMVLLLRRVRRHGSTSRGDLETRRPHRARCRR